MQVSDAALFECVFFSGLRLSEALTLRWDAVDEEKRTAHVCRGIALGEVVERTKTGGDRFVLLNDRAMHALHFPPSKNPEYVKQTSDIH